MMRKLLGWKGWKQNSQSLRRARAARSRRKVALCDTLLGVERLEGRWMLAAGALDPTFNPTGSPPGTLLADLGFIEDGQSVAVQSSGKILIAGTIQPSSLGASFQNYGVARYLPNGTLDTTFGTTDTDGVNGLASLDFFGEQDAAFDMIIDSAGRIVVAGRASNGVSSGIGITRFDANGNLDTTFGSSGKVFLAIPTFGVEPRAIAEQVDGKLVVAGSARNGGSSTNQFLVARFSGAGVLDTASFGGGVGYVMTDFAGDRDQAFAVDIQGDGGIVVGGTSVIGPDTVMALARYTTSGSLDTLFDGDGLVTVNVTGLAGSAVDSDQIEDIAIQADGKIVVAGHTQSADFGDAVLGRFNTNGSLDATFNSSGSQPGINRIDFNTRDFVEGLVIQADGNYVAAGTSTITTFGPLTNNEQLLVLRVLASTGQLDATFGSGGATITNLAAGSTIERHRDVALQPDGKIVAGGLYNDLDFVLARYESAAAAPLMADAGGPYSLNEPGGSLVLSASGTTGGVAPLTYEWDLDGDSIFGETGAGADNGDEVGVNPTFTDTGLDGPSAIVVSLRVTDSTTPTPVTSTDTATINVLNVAPTLTISGAASVNEGALYTLILSSSDPGPDTIASWEITWGDGAVETIVGNPSSVTHTYADGPNSYPISATATDEDGTYTASGAFSVTVTNVAPTLTLSGSADVDEGAVYTLNLSSLDPGTDTITSWTINWGDGSEVVSGNPASVTHTYADGDNNYTISATATDEDGTFAAGNTVAVTVNNVAPTADAGGPYATFSDTPITLNGSATDPAGAADPLTFIWDLDGDSIFGETGAGATRGDEVGATPTYDPTGLPTSTQTVEMRVSDGDGGVTTVSTTIDIIAQGTVQIGGVLYIVGTENCDIVVITKVGSSIKVIASFNDSNPLLFNESSITEIQVRMRGGSDIVVTTPNVTKLMTIDGGSGNDLLTGGGGRNVITGGTGHDILHGDGGDDVLLGGDGNDDLFGGSGNDILVGGNGCDILNGGTGRDVVIGSQDEDLLNGGGDEDILIGGWTIHDNSVAALDAIMAVWGSAASFNSRVATLTGSGGLLQAGTAVFDDDDCDIIVGGAGRDLVFGDTNPWDGAIDLIALQALQDVLVAVN